MFNRSSVRCLNCGFLRLGADGVTAVPPSNRETPRRMELLANLRLREPWDQPFTCYVSAYSLAAECDDPRNTGDSDAERWYLTVHRPRKCASFVTHIAGLNCAEHLSGQQRARERREERRWATAMALVAFVGGVLTRFLPF